VWRPTGPAASVTSRCQAATHSGSHGESLRRPLQKKAAVSMGPVAVSTPPGPLRGRQPGGLGHGGAPGPAGGIAQEQGIVSRDHIAGHAEVDQHHVGADFTNRCCEVRTPVAALRVVAHETASEFRPVPHRQPARVEPLQAVGCSTAGAVPDDEHPDDPATAVRCGRIGRRSDRGRIVGRTVASGLRWRRVEKGNARGGG